MSYRRTKKCFSSFFFTVKRVISELKLINSSTITLDLSPLMLLDASCQANSISFSLFNLVCPFARRRHHWLYYTWKLIFLVASDNSSRLDAYLYFAVFIPNEVALFLISSLFIVKFTAFAEGTILKPCSSKLSKFFSSNCFNFWNYKVRLSLLYYIFQFSSI